MNTAPIHVTIYISLLDRFITLNYYEVVRGGHSQTVDLIRKRTNERNFSNTSYMKQI